VVNSFEHSTKLIAFYLPQYHPIPENDRWWGEGFTDWTNVRKAKPRFSGHHQPHEPSALGYYDLRDPGVRKAQADLARAHGIHGFCYYHYWFNGTQLLETPFNEVLRSGEPDLPFCLCWANENWTRRWDGKAHQTLIAQDYSAYDPEAHLDSLAVAFRDPRYIRVGEKPLFLVYRPNHIPHLTEVVAAWRRAAARRGIPGLYLCGVREMGHRIGDEGCFAAGFDGLVDFQPNALDVAAALGRVGFGEIPVRAWGLLLRTLNRLFPGIGNHTCYDYGKVARFLAQQGYPLRRIFPCVFPSWDNSARRKNGAIVIQNDDPALFEQWLDAACRRVESYPEEERVVFVNAWNEWAEGCHLEPDWHNGLRFLEAVRACLGAGRKETP
jgi:hypothetical protein